MSETFPFVRPALRAGPPARRARPRPAGGARPRHGAAGRARRGRASWWPPPSPPSARRRCCCATTPGIWCARSTAPPTCALRQQPATSDLLGKRSLSVRHDGGWITPRQVLEALEALDERPAAGALRLLGRSRAGSRSRSSCATDDAATRRAVERGAGGARRAGAGAAPGDRPHGSCVTPCRCAAICAEPAFATRAARTLRRSARRRRPWES